MDKKSERLRGFENESHMLQVDVNKKLFTRFKAQCIKDGYTIKEKISEMMKSSLKHI
tara:strand:- start:275 stop:445 length:171 start_codon:yes stop_codon:yes gene_type:complete